MATNLDSVVVVAGADATAAQYNGLRKDLIKNAGDYETAGGTGDVITLAIDAVYVAYAAGDVIRFQAAAINTTTVTINVNSIGAKTIKKWDEGTLVVLVAGDIASGAEVVIQYDGTDFQLTSPTNKGFTGADKETLRDGSDADALHIHHYNKLADTDLTQDTYSNDGSEITLYSYSIPANSLESANGIRVNILLSSLDDSGSSSPTVFDLNYGSTTIASVSADFGQPNTHVRIEGLIFANGGTAAQNGYLSVMTNSTPAAALGSGTATEDSTGALTLSVTVDAASSGADTIFDVGYTEILK